MSDLTISSENVISHLSREASGVREREVVDVLSAIGTHFQQYGFDGPLPKNIEDAFSKEYQTCYLPTFTALYWGMQQGHSVGIAVNTRAHPFGFIRTKSEVIMFDYMADDEPVRFERYDTRRFPRFVPIDDREELIKTIQIFDSLEKIMEDSETGQTVDFSEVQELDFTRNNYFMRLAKRVAGNPL